MRNEKKYVNDYYIDDSNNERRFRNYHRFRTNDERKTHYHRHRTNISTRRFSNYQRSQIEIFTRH